MPNERIAESARQAQSDFEAAARKADKCEEGLAAQLLRIFAGACGVEATCAEYDDAPGASAPDVDPFTPQANASIDWDSMSVGSCSVCGEAHHLVNALCYDCRQPSVTPSEMYYKVRLHFADQSSAISYVPEDEDIAAWIADECEELGWDAQVLVGYTLITHEATYTKEELVAPSDAPACEHCDDIGIIQYGYATGLECACSAPPVTPSDRARRIEFYNDKWKAFKARYPDRSVVSDSTAKRWARECEQFMTERPNTLKEI